MKIRERVNKYFREKSPLKITGDLVFYLLILAVLLPFSRKPLAEGLNRLIMHRPAVLSPPKQIPLTPEDEERPRKIARNAGIVFSCRQT